MIAAFDDGRYMCCFRQIVLATAMRAFCSQPSRRAIRDDDALKCFYALLLLSLAAATRARRRTRSDTTAYAYFSTMLNASIRLFY